MTIIDAALVSDMQAMLRRLDKGKLAAIGTDEGHDDGAFEAVQFLTDRCGWSVKSGPIYVGTGAASTARAAVLQDIHDALNHGDDLASDLAPQSADLVAGLTGELGQITREIEAYGKPLDHQLRALGQACVRLLERNPGYGD